MKSYQEIIDRGRSLLGILESVVNTDIMQLEELINSLTEVVIVEAFKNMPGGGIPGKAYKYSMHIPYRSRDKGQGPVKPERIKDTDWNHPIKKLIDIGKGEDTPWTPMTKLDQSYIPQGHKTKGAFVGVAKDHTHKILGVHDGKDLALYHIDHKGEYSMLSHTGSVKSIHSAVLAKTGLDKDNYSWHAAGKSTVNNYKQSNNYERDKKRESEPKPIPTSLAVQDKFLGGAIDKNREAIKTGFHNDIHEYMTHLTNAMAGKEKFNDRHPAIERIKTRANAMDNLHSTMRDTFSNDYMRDKDRTSMSRDSILSTKKKINYAVKGKDNFSRD